MAGQLVGADLGGLDDLRASFERAAGDVRRLSAAIDRELDTIGAVWLGGDAVEFVHTWRGIHRPRLLNVGSSLDDVATSIAKNRAQQDETSAAERGGFGVAPVPGIATSIGGGGISGGPGTQLGIQEEGPWGLGPPPAGNTGLPGFPVPPPAPESGDGSGEHGSKGRNFLQDRWDDTQRAFWFEVADSADALGLDNAGRHMRHYLGNSGEPLEISPDEMINDLPGLEQAIEDTIQFDLQDRINERIADNYNGEPLTFQVTTDWEGYYAGKNESQDWFYGLGGFSYAVGAEVTVVPGPDGTPTVQVTHQTHVFDRYNWDDGKQVSIGPVTVSDSSLGHLHEVGKAQEFEVRGTSDPASFSYEYTGSTESGADGGSSQPPQPVDVEGSDDGRNRTDDPTRNEDRSRRSGDRESDGPR